MDIVIILIIVLSLAAMFLTGALRVKVHTTLPELSKEDRTFLAMTLRNAAAGYRMKAELHSLSSYIYAIADRVEAETL